MSKAPRSHRSCARSPAKSWRIRSVADYYSSCTDLIENLGHPFGEGLSQADKNALIAFVATL